MAFAQPITTPHKGTLVLPCWWMNVSGSQDLPTCLLSLGFLHSGSSWLPDSRAQASPDFSYPHVASVLHFLSSLSLFKQANPVPVLETSLTVRVKSTNPSALFSLIFSPCEPLRDAHNWSPPPSLTNLLSFTSMHHMLLIFLLSLVPFLSPLCWLIGPWSSGLGPGPLFVVYTHSLPVQPPLLSWMLTQDMCHHPTIYTSSPGLSLNSSFTYSTDCLTAPHTCKYMTSN